MIVKRSGKGLFNYENIVVQLDSVNYNISKITVWSADSQDIHNITKNTYDTPSLIESLNLQSKMNNSYMRCLLEGVSPYPGLELSKALESDYNEKVFYYKTQDFIKVIIPAYVLAFRIDFDTPSQNFICSETVTDPEAELSIRDFVYNYHNVDRLYTFEKSDMETCLEVNLHESNDHAHLNSLRFRESSSIINENMYESQFKGIVDSYVETDISSKVIPSFTRVGSILMTGSGQITWMGIPIR